MTLDGGGGPRVVRLRPGGAADALEEAGVLLSAGCRVIVLLDPYVSVDAGTVGALARLVLLARRSGADPLVVRAPDTVLPDLADLMGLCEVLRLRENCSGGEPPSGHPQR